MSQEQLAARAGLHRTEIGLLENGKRTPLIDTVIKLAAALEVEFADLIQGIEWIPDDTPSRGQFWDSGR